MRDQRLFLFDLDHTLLPFDSGLAWSRLLVEQGLLDESVAEAYLNHCMRYVAGNLSIEALHGFAVSSLLPSDRDILRTCQASFQAYLSARISDAARKLVDASQEAGLCAIVTATNAHIAQPAARAFGVAHLIATNVFCTDDGRPRMVAPACHGTEKVARVSAWLDTQQLRWTDFCEVHFFSDSASDLPLLHHATHPTAVHPDGLLREHALQKGWCIRDNLYA